MEEVFTNLWLLPVNRSPNHPNETVIPLPNLVKPQRV